MRRLHAIAALLPALALACAASPAMTLGADHSRLDRAVAVLEGREDADSLAAAALLTLDKPAGGAWELLTRAVTLAPGRADLVWLQLQSCLKQPQCDAAAVSRRLQILDPGNGAAQLSLLARADGAHDDAAEAAALQAISHSTRVDLYWTSLVARLSAAAVQTREISLAEAETAVIGVLAARAIPAYALIANSCKGQRLSRTGMIDTCRGVARSLQGGDTYITEMIGVAIAQRVWPKDSSEWRAADEARHVFHYRARLSTKIDGVWTESTARSYLALYESNHREQDVFRSRLIAAGYPPDPRR